MATDLSGLDNVGLCDICNGPINRDEKENLGMCTVCVKVSKMNDDE